MILIIIGNVNNIDALKIIDFSVFSNIKWVPDFAFIHAIKGINDFSSSAEFFKYLALIVVLYAPVAFVSFAEHIADHKNIFVISAILVVGIGGLTIRFYRFEFSPIACALTAGLLVNLLANIKTKKDIKKQEAEEQK